MSARLRTAALLLAGALPGAACAAWSGQAAPDADPQAAPRGAPPNAHPAVKSTSPAPLRAAETFAVVWEKLRDSGFGEDRDDIDWAALEARHRPAIEGAEDLSALRRELNRLLQAVGVSHLGLIPAEAIPQPRARPASKASAGPDASAAAGTKPSRGPGSAAKPSRPDTVADAADSGGRAEADALAKTQVDAEDDASTPEDEAQTRAALGLRVMVIGGALHLLQVEAGSPAAAAGLRPGWQLEAIDDWAIAPAVASVLAQPDGMARRRALLGFEMAANERLSDLDPEDTVRLRLRDTLGQPRVVALTARETPGPYLQLMPGMPPMPFRYRAERLNLPTGACTLHVEFDLWAQPAFDRLAATLREQPDCDRLILDLRGNPGGQLFSMTAVGGLLYDKTTSLGAMKTAQGTLRLTVLPRRVADDGTRLRRLGGPVAVLIDRGSASSSEIFTAGLQATSRARVFGETSAGMALPAITARLPSGDWLYFPTADMTDPDGRRIEGQGVAPDVVITPTVATLAAGQDPALAAAMDWIARPAGEPVPATRGAR